MAFVHFRALKNVQSRTVQALLKAAECLKREFGSDVEVDEVELKAHGQSVDPDRIAELSKDQLEAIAAKFRSDLKLHETAPLDVPENRCSRECELRGLPNLTASDSRTMRRLRNEACSEWSAMSVPLDRLRHGEMGRSA